MDSESGTSSMSAVRLEVTSTSYGRSCSGSPESAKMSAKARISCAASSSCPATEA